MTYALITGALAAIIAALAGGPTIRMLRERGFAKSISADGPESHLSKAGTPTMGGVLIFGVALAAGAIAGLPKDRDILLPLVVAVVLLGVGIFDDMGTLLDRESREAHDRQNMIQKLVGFAAVAIVAAWALYDSDVIGAPRMLVPNRDEPLDIGPLYIVIAIAVMVSTISAVGVSDGLDMLEGGLCLAAYAGFGAIALLQDQDGAAIFAFAIAGALVGFLYWNAYPARLFMGDAGALPLGGGLAVLALMTGWWLLVPVIGVVFLIEILSDVIQIGSYRLRGTRVFRMAPIHHHFEELGWHEVTITARFVALGVVGALAGVALAAWGR